MNREAQVNSYAIARDCPPLPASEQLELAARAQRATDARCELAGNGHDPIRRAELEAIIAAGEAARCELITHNSRLILKVAYSYTGHGVPAEDLFQEGVIGLMTAIDKFDSRYNVKFSTHAVWWIRQAITRCVAADGRAIRLPVHRHDQVVRINKEKSRLAHKLGRDPTVEELSDAVGWNNYAMELHELLQVSSVPQSLDESLINDANNTLVDFVVSDCEAQETTVERDEIARRIQAIVETLPEREADVVKMRFGIGCDAHTLIEIGDKLGVTRERARQIINEAMRRLRHPSRRRLLVGLN